MNPKSLALHVLLLQILSTSATGDAQIWACTNSSGDIDLSSLPCSAGRGIVHGSFRNQINETGWSFLEVVASKENKATDLTLAYAAGAVEGRLTAELIYWHWLNTVSGYCEGVEDYCRRLETFLARNWAWMQGEIDAKPSDPFWHHVNLILHQLAGLIDGYYLDVKAPHSTIDVSGFLMFQLAGDLESIEQALGKPAWKLRKLTGSGSCSALIKVLDQNADLLFAHDTWSTYQSMLRVMKLYRLPFKISQSSAEQVPGASVSFSGYPGTLPSIDDFYLSSSGLAVTETTIGNSNSSLWSFVRPVGTVMTWIRSQVATRLANTAMSWGLIFKKKTSGTYNNQWMVVDYKKFTPNAPLPSSGLFMVLEQIPGTVIMRDQTAFLASKRFWPSYNSPFYPEVFNRSGCWANVAKYGDWFSYDRTPRALIFKRDAPGVTDMDSLLKLMRSNNFTQDPLSRCAKCSPGYSAENAISARCDLNPADGTYPFASLGHRSHGGIDMKATNWSLMAQLSMLAVSGPTWESQPAFAWSLAQFPGDTPHFAHPDEWKFEPLLVRWTPQ